MDLTEKDMRYIVRGRSSKKQGVRLIAVTLATLIPFILLIALGGFPGAVSGIIWLCVGFGVVMVTETRAEKALKAEAKKMFEAWQFYTDSVIAAPRSSE